VYDPSCPTLRSRLYPLCRQLAERNYEFTFFVLGNKTEEISPGITYKGYKDYKELVTLTMRLHRENVDAVIACKSYSITGFLSYLVAKSKGFGYLLDIDDRTFPSEINKWWRIPLYIQELLIEKIMMLLKPPTTVASKALQKYWGTHAVYMPNSADLTFFNKTKWLSNICKEKHNIAGKVVIWPAVFFQEVDRNYAVEIFDVISIKRKDIALLILGAGEYLPHIQNKVQKRGTQNIIFAGEIDFEEMPRYYASADAGLLPLRDNHYDACKGPIKLYEYMAMELPIIATPVGEPKEMIEAADCGVFIPFNDAEKASDVIIDLLESKEKLNSLGKNGRTYLKKFQTLEKLAETFESVLSSTVSQKPPEA
jgi:glycosyltransferase involved in cell wall biosynthesis